jgi:streptogramin lyase
MRAPKTGGAPVVFAAASQPSAIAIASDGTVYWVDAGTTLRSAPESGTLPVALATIPSGAHALAVDAQYVYVAEGANLAVPYGQIERIARAGAARNVIATCPSPQGPSSGAGGATQVVVDADGFYYVCEQSFANGEDYQASFAQSWDGSCNTQLTMAYGVSIAVSGAWIYATYSYEHVMLLGFLSVLAKLPKFGGDSSYMASVNSAFVVDDTYFYWWDGKAIRREMK